jgi:hypothetical protein
MKLPSPAPLRDAETSHVWVIVPFSRPENLGHVMANFRRQKFPFKKLCLVENGRARAASVEPRQSERLQAHLLLTSDAHQSAAKNTALSEIRKRGGGFTVVMDDDDWYGPQFLTEAVGYAKTYNVTGKNRHFVSMDGHLWLCSRERAHRRNTVLNGGTIACWAEHAPEYQQVAHGEDVVFCNEAERRGMKCFGTDLYHYLYRRESSRDHAWRISAEQLRDYESASGALDLGIEDLEIVTGQKLVVEGSVLLAREDADTLVPPAPPGAQHVTT